MPCAIRVRLISESFKRRARLSMKTESTWSENCDMIYNGIWRDKGEFHNDQRYLLDKMQQRKNPENEKSRTWEVRGGHKQNNKIFFTDYSCNVFWRKESLLFKFQLHEWPIKYGMLLSLLMSCPFAWSAWSFLFIHLQKSFFFYWIQPTKS